VSDPLTSTSRRVRPRAEANVGYLFRLAHQRFRAALEDGLRDLGLSAQECVILSVFETRSDLTSSDLARITQVTRQTMHTAVLGLETAGLLERRTRNQRVVLLRPTRRGRRTLAAATDRVREIERAALAGLSRGEERTARWAGCSRCGTRRLIGSASRAWSRWASPLSRSQGPACGCRYRC
jgi:DNA-binding MarR family transcriptional regulator